MLQHLDLKMLGLKFNSETQRQVGENAITERFKG